MSDGTQVEYCALTTFVVDAGFTTREKNLNTLAENGWRLVTTVSVRDRVIDTLERPVA